MLSFLAYGTQPTTFRDVLMFRSVARRRHDVAVRVTVVNDVIASVTMVAAVEVELADGVRPVAHVRKRSPFSWQIFISRFCVMEKNWNFV